MRRVSGSAKVVVLGAGVTGLSAAWQLSRNGISVALIERNSEPGGLARSVHLGDCHFDYGIHGFFCSKEGNERYLDMIRDLIGEELAVVEKKTSIFFRGKHVKYPLGVRDLFLSLDPVTAALCFFSFLKARLKLRARRMLKRTVDEESFKTWVGNRFGRRLYHIYFESFATKVWGLDSARLSSGSLGRRITTVSIWDVVKKSLMKACGLQRLIDRMYPQQPMRFLYARQGVDKFPRRLAADILSYGGRIELGARLERIETPNRSISVDYVSSRGMREKVECEYLISTIPVDTLVRVMGAGLTEQYAAANLRYRAMIIVNIACKKKLFEDQWVYFPQKDVVFSRINEFGNIHPSLMGNGTRPLSVEIPCFENDEIFRADDETILDIVLKDLKRLDLLDEPDVIEYEISRLINTYPIYTVDSKRHASIFRSFLESKENVFSIGRQGGFEYINMDECMERGMAAADSIIMEEGGSEHDTRFQALHRRRGDQGGERGPQVRLAGSGSRNV